eukprot:scaffold15073_cov72-Cyclotella_meneghiniana.AAC.6
MVSCSSLLDVWSMMRCDTSKCLAMIPVSIERHVQAESAVCSSMECLRFQILAGKINDVTNY